MAKKTFQEAKQIIRERRELEAQGVARFTREDMTLSAPLTAEEFIASLKAKYGLEGDQ
jgi:hypothetical protein